MKKHSKQTGISLVEILLSLAIFSLGIVGLYLSIQAMNKNLQLSAQRDLEAAYANILIGEVDPYYVKGQANYDLTDNNNKGTVSLPDGRTVYYLREVRAEATSADVMEINVYFYHQSNAAANAPYRHFKRDIALNRANHQMRITTGPTSTKSTDGTIWSHFSRLQNYSLTADDYQIGLDNATTGATQAGTDAECSQQHIANATSERIIYIIPATAGHEYKLELGLCEPTDAATIGSRIMEVLINDTLTDEVDIVDEVGSANTFLNKTYSATPTTLSGVSVIKLELRRKSGSPATLPLISQFSVIR